MKDTVAQIATASGAGGVGIVRLSGARALAIGRALIGVSREIEERRMLFASARAEDGETIDQGLYVEFHAPRSLTGEDVAEFQGHGGSVGLARLLARCIELGARAAEAGEFLRRAFEHGKIDLARAEAIAAAVAAETEAAHRIAQRQAMGELSRAVAAIRAPLIDAATELNAEIEFPDEDLSALDVPRVLGRLQAARTAVTALLQGFRGGRLLLEGARVAIVGPPNAGKSSLLNALVGFERAIVSPVAGTTRDTVEERAAIGGVAVRFVDTAGLRDAEDQIEQAGIARTRAAMQRADVVLAVVSADSEWRAFVEREPLRDAIWICNKSDVAAVPPAWRDVVGEIPVLSVSARTGEGVEALRAEIARRVASPESDGAPLVTQERHATLLGEAAAALERARAALAMGVSADLVLIDVGISIHRLGAVLGENLGEEVYAEIFRRFCIGK